MISAMQILKGSNKRNNEHLCHFLEVSNSKLPEATINLLYSMIMDKY